MYIPQKQAWLKGKKARRSRRILSQGWKLPQVITIPGYRKVVDAKDEVSLALKKEVARQMSMLDKYHGLKNRLLHKVYWHPREHYKGTVALQSIKRKTIVG